MPSFGSLRRGIEPARPTEEPRRAAANPSYPYYLYRRTPSRTPKAPPTLRRLDGEWFIAGTETSAPPVRAFPGDIRIAYPADGTIIALDPDIPPEQQRVFFESRPSAPELRWVLNGEDLGTAGSLQLWPPCRGSYRLSLVDASRRVLDSVGFVVR